MKNKFLKRSSCRDLVIGGLVIALSLALGGCAVNSPEQSETLPEVVALTPMPPLAYYMMLSRMTQAELGRGADGADLAAAWAEYASPDGHVVRLFTDAAGPFRAISLLDSVLKAKEPAAIALQPLARLLADNYAERQRLDTHLDRQGAQLKESQRKAAELQEKIESLADIERTLPQRPRAARPVTSGKAK